MKSLLYIGNKLSGHGKTPTAIETLGPYLESEGFKVGYASSRRNKILRLLEMLWKTASTQADYVLIDTYSTTNFWYAVAVSQLSRVLNKKYIPILHGGGLPHRLRNNPVLCRMVFKHSYINIAPSGYLLEAFNKMGYDNVRYVPNPITLSDFIFKPRQNPAPKILWVRSLAPIYNPEMALQVFAALKKSHPDAELCMVGPDNSAMLGTLKQLAAKHNIEVTFTGRLSRQEWAGLSTRYDIFINTAKIDNAPFSLIEALALGLFVVSTNVGGIPFLLEDKKTALLVKDNDSNAMVLAINDIIVNEGLRKVLTSNSRIVVANFDWDTVKQKWFEILV